MKTYNNYLLTAGITVNFLAAGLFAFAQDLHFSQYYFTPHLLNPAMTGANGYMEAQLNYKEQWRSVAVPYKTFSVSYCMRMNKKKWDDVDKKRTPFFFKKAPGQGLAWGVTLYNDNAGDASMHALQANLSLAYHVMITKEMIFAAGLLGGVLNRSIDASKLQWGSQYDGKQWNPAITPASPIQNESFTQPDVGAGLDWYLDKDEKSINANDHLQLSAGVAMFHVNQPNYSFYNNPDEKLFRKFTAHATGNIGIKNTPLSILPSLAWFQQGPATEMLTGGLIRYRLKEESKYTGRLKGASIAFGGHYRNKDAVILSTHLQLAYYSIGVSYDINISDLRSASSGRGSYEISLRFVDTVRYLYQTKPQI
ncbi:MAG: PorP/SprF family type IX secretion system membrane protein [Bacteroidetes bacterium]|nr:PorP/SprF family type IX secretion system membrane protein [Bacteroidota bacterium]